MRLFVTAVNEPIYLVPYIRAVLQTCGATVVGVAEVRSKRRPFNAGRSLSLALLALLVLSPRQIIRLAGLRVREWFAGLGVGTTRHRLADVCRELSVPFHTIESANDPVFCAQLVELKVDVLLNQTSELLREPLLGIPRMGVINRHLSPLPSYRGAWPIFWQFANREPRLGVTIHLVDRGLDTGAIIAQQTVARSAMSMSAAVADLFERSVPLTCEALRRLNRGEPLQPNDGMNASTFRTPTPAQIVSYMLGLPVRARIA